MGLNIVKYLRKLGVQNCEGVKTCGGHNFKGAKIAKKNVSELFEN